jgi:hypothetical protein
LKLNKAVTAGDENKVALACKGLLDCGFNKTEIDEIVLKIRDLAASKRSKKTAKKAAKKAAKKTAKKAAKKVAKKVAKKIAAKSAPPKTPGPVQGDLF